MPSTPCTKQVGFGPERAALPKLDLCGTCLVWCTPGSTSPASFGQGGTRAARRPGTESDFVQAAPCNKTQLKRPIKIAIIRHEVIWGRAGAKRPPSFWCLLPQQSKYEQCCFSWTLPSMQYLTFGSNFHSYIVCFHYAIVSEIAQAVTVVIYLLCCVIWSSPGQRGTSVWRDRCLRTLDFYAGTCYKVTFLINFVIAVGFIHYIWHIKLLYLGIKDTILQHIGKLICFSQLVLCPNISPWGATRVYRLQENEPQQQVAFCSLMNMAICYYHGKAFHQTIRQLSM